MYGLLYIVNNRCTYSKNAVQIPKVIITTNIMPLYVFILNNFRKHFHIHVS